MISKKKTIFSENTLDMETGELKQKKWVTTKVDKKDEFVALYMEHISIFSKLSATETKFLIGCTKYIEWNTNELVFSPKVMEGICEQSGLTAGSVRNSLSRCTQKGLFAKKKSNWYILNPNVFFKGNEIARAKMFEMSYRWEIKEKGFKRVNNE